MIVGGYGRSRRYVSGVVVLNREDAYFLSRILDERSISRAFSGSNESLIDSLRAIGMASEDFACANARKTPKNNASSQELDQWLTPLQIADQLKISHAAISLALRDGRLVGTKVDGRWRIRPSDYQTYKASRLDRRTA